MEIKEIGHLKTLFPTKFGVPRQSGVSKSSPATLIFNEEINKIIDKTSDYIVSRFYEKMTYGEVASLNMFVMLLRENFQEELEKKKNDWGKIQIQRNLACITVGWYCLCQ